MNGTPRAGQLPEDDTFSFRCREGDRIAEIHREGRRLIKEAQAARQQYELARARMQCVQHDIRQGIRSGWERPTAESAGALLQQEREAHGLSKLALDRELARGQRLEDEVLVIQDQERERLARDLHDGAHQSLSAVTFLLELHLRQLRDLDPDSQALQMGKKVREMLSETIQEMRGLAHGLSGVETGADGENLSPALHALAGRISAAGSVRCAVVCPDLPALGQANATHLYRIVQEALNNAVRHGKAGRIEICLVRSDARWRLTVTDDGVGIAPKATSKGGGLGTRSMQYRAAVVGGTLEVRRGRGTLERPGTVVSCTFA